MYSSSVITTSGPGRRAAALPASHYSHKRLSDSLRSPKDSIDTTFTTKRRTFSWNAHYASDATYMGRKDSLNHLVLSPSFTYTGIHGFSTSLTASHIEFTDKPVKLKNGTVLTRQRPPVLDEYDWVLGWDHDWTENFSTSIGNTHSYFDAKSPRVRSTINNDFNIGATYDFNLVVADVSGDWAHGPKTVFGQAKDYFYTMSLSHDFDYEKLFKTSGELEIEPRLSMAYGTQNFFKLYVKAGVPTNPALQQAIEKQKKLAQFSLLNYTLAVPLTYTWKKVAFVLEWDYNIPQNVAQGSSSSPFSVIMFDVRYTRKGKPVRLKKKSSK